MKHIKQILAVVVMLITLTAYAESDGTTITISSNVALPVRVKPNGGSAFTISSRSYTTSKRIADATFYDAKGNRCMYDHRSNHSGGNVHHYYTITGVYSSSSSSYENSSSSSSGNTDITDYPPTSWSPKWIPDNCNGHPYLALGLGISKSCGEFARLKWTHGGSFGMVISGSIGKDWIFKEDYCDKLCWNAGAGVRFSDENNEIELNVLVGRTPWHPDPALMMNLEYAHYFGDSKFFGVFGSIGFAGTNMGGDGDAKAYFDFMAGVAVKLWQK